MTEGLSAAQDLLRQMWIRNARDHEQRDSQCAEHGRHLDASAKQVRLQHGPALCQSPEMSFGDRAAHDGQRGKATGRRGGRQSTKALAAVWVNLGLDVEPR